MQIEIAIWLIRASIALTVGSVLYVLGAFAWMRWEPAVRRAWRGAFPRYRRAHEE